MTPKKAVTDFPIQELFTERWSPYSFSDRAVSQSDLCSLFEAARWAASSYNEQPWSYIVATKENPAEFARVLSCLVEGNQAWAKAAPVLALGLAKSIFSHNKQDNRVAVHDLGQAAACLTMEATARGLSVHQMAGIVPAKARELFQFPEHIEAWTGIAIGYKGDPAQLPEAMRARDTSARQRKPLSQFVFTGKWGQTSPLVK